MRPLPARSNRGGTVAATIATLHHAVAARPRRVAIGVLLVAALLAGCGGGNTANLDADPASTPASGGTATAPRAETPADATEPVDASQYEVEPESYGEPESDVAPEGYVEPAPESDAGAWVDRRQDDVLDDVHENNMEATEVWTR